MFRLRSVFSFLLVALILPYGGILPAANTPAAMPEILAKSNFVNLYIDEIEILGDIGDFSGQGEFRLIVLAADTRGKSSGMFCPGKGPIKVSRGDTVPTPCLLAISFPEDQVSEGVYISLMVIDEDKSSLPADLAYEAAVGYLNEKLEAAFTSAVKSGAVKVAARLAGKSNPYVFVATVLTSFLAGKAKAWIEQADIIGSHGIYLTRKDNWAADQTRSVTSSDGGVRIQYTVVRTSSAPSHPQGPVLDSSPGTSQPPSSSSSTPKYQCDDLNYVRLKVGDRAKVVWPKVNLRTSPVVPQEYYGNSIAQVEEKTTLTVIGGPACAHEGTWWQVRLRNGQTGWMREHISTGYLIGK